MNWNPKAPAIISTWTALAPETVRERKIRSGISGRVAVAWRTRKAAISASDRAPQYAVAAEVQPRSEVSTMV